MAKNTLEIIIKANSAQAQRALKELQSAIGKPFTGLQKQVGALGTAFQSVTGISLGAAGAFTAVGMAASKAADFVKQSVVDTVNYAQSVRELSYVLGTNAEETSRIIQVADDYLISTEKLSTALRYAVKNGFAPTIESLAQLADRFNSISDPTQRAAEMVKIFGRNWSALVPLLQAGGDAIRANAAAISEGLVLNESDIQSVFEYQQALDQLGDSVQDLKNRIGMALIPVMADLLTTFNTNAAMADQMVKSFAAFPGVIEQTNRSALALQSAFEQGFNVSPQGLANIAKQLQAIEDPMKRVAEAQRIFGENWVEVYGIIELAPNVLDALSGSLGKIPPDMNEITRSAKVMAGALDEASESEDELADTAKKLDNDLRDYAKVLDKLGLSTNQQNKYIEQFAAGIGATSAGALTLANDVDLLNAAVEAGVISIGAWTQYMQDAADGTFELTKEMRDYIDAALEGGDAQAILRKQMEASANAVSSTRAQLIGLAEAMRTAGPRERRNIVLDQLKELLSTTVDPAKARAIADGIMEIEKAVGLISPTGEGKAQALNDLVKALFSGQIDPSVFDEALFKIDEAIRTLKPGETIDVFGILQNAGLMPSSSDMARIEDEWAKVAEIPAKALEAFAEEDISEKASGVITGIDTAMANIAANAEPVSTGISMMSESLMSLTGNAVNVNMAVGVLDDNILSAGMAAEIKAPSMENFAKTLNQVRSSANQATNAVMQLKAAIDALHDKTITITVLYVVSGFGGGYGFQSGGPSGKPTAAKPRPYLTNKPRQAGGLVDPFSLYLVGEKGPELFIPGRPELDLPDNTASAVMAVLGAISEKNPTLIGQKGPERFIPRRAGTIIPNDITALVMAALGAMGVSSTKLGSVLAPEKTIKVGHKPKGGTPAEPPTPPALPIGWGGLPAKDWPPTLGIPMAASGGFLPGRLPAIVGEKGPELFVPNQPGMVIPNDLTAAILATIGTALGPSIGALGGSPPGIKVGHGPPKNPQTPVFIKGTHAGGGTNVAPLPQAVGVPEYPNALNILGALGLTGTQDTFADVGAGIKVYHQNDKALEQALNQTYKPFIQGTGKLIEPAPMLSEYESSQMATAETQTERVGRYVTYNSYFPIQRVDDTLDARALARLVAAELARMPSR